MTTPSVTPTIDTFDQKFHTLTDRYKLAKTRDIIDYIVSLGFQMDTFVANKTRKKERVGFQKHRAIFSSPLMKATADGIPQLLLTNSHDGTTCIELQLGFWRGLCANGLVFGTSIAAPIKIRHSGEGMQKKLEDAITLMVQQAEKIAESIDKLKAVTLTPAQVVEFQRSALELRLGAKVDSFTMPIKRKEDAALDVFTVMNVVQENLIRGGATAQYTKDGKTNNKAVRKLQSIQAQTEINVQLWEMAEALAA